MFSHLQTTELIGYLASILVAVSLMMSAIVRLRIINLIGAVCFTIYGLIISAYPVVFVNGFITLVDVYFLINILAAKEYFNVLEVSKESDYLKYFLEFHKSDIKQFVPSFSFNLNENSLSLFILRNSVPAGLVCAEYKSQDDLFISLDYAIPGYRDFKTGKYAFNKIFKEKNLKKIYSEPGNKKHEEYLKKMGFKLTGFSDGKVYCLDIN